jgi:hypothetical protein
MASAEEQTRPETRMTYADASTRRITADTAIEYAYRELGEGEVPLVLLQHFRGVGALSHASASCVSSRGSR